MSAIISSIKRSISYTEIVTVRVTDRNAALAEAKSIATEAGFKFDWTDAGEHLDAWAYSAAATEGEKIWRLRVEKSNEHGAYDPNAITTESIRTARASGALCAERTIADDPDTEGLNGARAASHMLSQAPAQVRRELGLGAGAEIWAGDEDAGYGPTDAVSTALNAYAEGYQSVLDSAARLGDAGAPDTDASEKS